MGSLYFEKLFPLRIDALVESIELIKKRIAPRIRQDKSHATCEGLCSEKDAIIDWSAPIDSTYNLIRATNPQPGATTHFRGQTLKIFDVRPLHDIAGGIPGQIAKISAEGVTVSLKRWAILIQKVQLSKSYKIEAAEFARQAELKTGGRFAD